MLSASKFHTSLICAFCTLCPLVYPFSYRHFSEKKRSISALVSLVCIICYFLETHRWRFYCCCPLVTRSRKYVYLHYQSTCNMRISFSAILRQVLTINSQQFLWGWNIEAHMPEQSKYELFRFCHLYRKRRILIWYS